MANLTPRNLAFVAGLLMIAVIAVAILVLRDSGDGDLQPGAVADVTPTNVVPVTVAPTQQTIAGPFADFKLEVAPTALQFASGGTDQIPSDKVGVWFLDIESGLIEGWIDSTVPSQLYAFSGDNRLTVFYRKPTSQSAAGYVIADRLSKTAYTWSGDAISVLSGTAFNGSTIAAAGGRVLLRIAVEGDNDWFAVIDLDAQGSVLSTFRAEAAFGLLSRDGNHAALLGEVLTLVDLQSGVARELARTQLSANQSRSLDIRGAVQILNTPDGGSFIVSFGLLAGLEKQEDRSAWARYTWDGSLVAEGAGTSEIYLSPSGEVIALAEPISATGDSLAPWYAFNTVDTRTGKDLFRVVGVRTALGYTTGNRWLADGSGLIVTDPSFRLWLAMRDGRFLPYTGMPSPESAGVFAVGSPVDGGPAVIDSSGNVLARISPPERSASFVPPWGEIGTEIRFITPHGGHGGIGFGVSLVQPYVETAPYSIGPPALQLKPEAVGARFRDAAGGGQVIGSLSDTARLTVHETSVLRLEPGQPGYSEQCDLMQLLTEQPPGQCFGALFGIWARATAGELTGWVLVEVRPEGE